MRELITRKTAFDYTNEICFAVDTIRAHKSNTENSQSHPLVVCAVTTHKIYAYVYMYVCILYTGKHRYLGAESFPHSMVFNCARTTATNIFVF